MTTENGFSLQGGTKVRSFLSANQNHVFVTKDIEARHGVQRGRAFRFARVEVESRVVPWTPDRPVRHQSLRQRTAVMCADGTRRREDLLALGRTMITGSPSNWPNNGKSSENASDVWRPLCYSIAYR
jgi:hypothetical protein